MGKQKLKKQMAGFLAVCMLMGTTSGYGMTALAEGENSAAVSQVWGIGEFEQLEISDTQPDGKSLMALFVQNGTYTMKENENNAIMMNNAEVVTGRNYSDDLLYRMAGDSKISFNGVDISSTKDRYPAYNGELNANALFQFYNEGVYEERPGNQIIYDYTVTGDFAVKGFLAANVFTVPAGKKFTADIFDDEGSTAGSLINVQNMIINGEVVMEKAGNDDKPTGINILDNGSLTVGEGGKISAKDGCELHILTDAKVNGLSLYDKDGEGREVEYSLPEEHGEEVFVCHNNKWMRMHFEGGHSIGFNRFIVDYTRFENEDGMKMDNVKVNGHDMDKNGEEFTFEAGQKITFELIPPEQRQGLDPVVEVYFENGETLSTKDSEHKLEVTDYEFSITPKDNTGFRVFIAWSEYDAVSFDQDEFLLMCHSHGGKIETSIAPNNMLIDPADQDSSKMVFDKDVLENKYLRLKFIPNEEWKLEFVSVRVGDKIKEYYVDTAPTLDDDIERVQMSEADGFTFEDGICVYTVTKISQYNDISVEPIYVDANHQVGYPNGIFVNNNGFKVEYKVGDATEFTELKEQEIPKDAYKDADSVTLKMTAPEGREAKHLRVRYDNNGEVIQRIPFPENGIYTITKDGDAWKGYEIEICDYDSLLDYQYRIDRIGNGPDITLEGAEFTMDEELSTFKAGDEISFKVNGMYHSVYVYPNDSEPKELIAKDGVYSYKPDNRGFFIHVYVTADDRDYETTQPDYSKDEFFINFMTSKWERAGGDITFTSDVKPVSVKQDSIGRTKMIMTKEAKKVELFITPDIRSDYRVEYKGNDVTEEVKKMHGIFVWDLSGDGRYEEPMITFVFAEKKANEVFTDVDKNQWYLRAVQYVFDNAIMNGTSDTTFAPGMILTREQFVTVLYNMEDRPSVDDAENFHDVKKGEYYEKPVLWAKTNQITSGISETEFGVGNQIPRQQLVTLLYNYAKIKGYDLTAKEDAISDFPDVKDVAEWAQTPVKWAVTNGVISGKKAQDGKNILDPEGKATRAECAQMIKNLKEKFEAMK